MRLISSPCFRSPNIAFFKGTRAVACYSEVIFGRTNFHLLPPCLSLSLSSHFLKNYHHILNHFNRIAIIHLYCPIGKCLSTPKISVVPRAGLIFFVVHEAIYLCPTQREQPIIQSRPCPSHLNTNLRRVSNLKSWTPETNALSLIYNCTLNQWEVRVTSKWILFEMLTNHRSVLHANYPHIPWWRLFAWFLKK